MAADLSGQEEGAPLSAINVTPFVDVVLVLLVIFMVTTPALVKESLHVNLPKAKSSDGKSTSPLAVVVTQQGQIILNGQLTTPDALQDAVRNALKQDPEARAILSADKETRHGDVVRAMD